MEEKEKWLVVVLPSQGCDIFWRTRDDFTDFLRSFIRGTQVNTIYYSYRYIRELIQLCKKERLLAPSRLNESEDFRVLAQWKKR